MPAPSPYLPRQSVAGIHAHVAGLRLVPAHRGGVDRNGGLPRPALGAVAGTCLLQVLRADADAAREALLRFRNGLAAALRPVGRGAGMGQTFLLAGDGNAPHDPTRAGRPDRPHGTVVRLSGAARGRKHHLRHLRHGRLPDRRAGGVHGRASRPVDARRARTGGVVVLFDRARRLLRRAAVFALHAYLHRDPAHLPASLRCAPAREGVVGRPLPDRSLLAVRHLHRPLPVAERAGHRRRFCAIAATGC